MKIWWEINREKFHDLIHDGIIYENFFVGRKEVDKVEFERQLNKITCTH